MADARQKQGASTAFTITLASLASSASAGRQSTAVDLATYGLSNPIIDAVIEGYIKLAVGAPANDKAVYAYIAGSMDGTNFGADVGATDAAYTLKSPSNLIPLRTIQTPDSGALTYRMQPNAIAQFFGGVFPAKIVLVVLNYSGVALDATGSAFSYTPVYHNVG